MLVTILLAVVIVVGNCVEMVISVEVDLLQKYN